METALVDSDVSDHEVSLSLSLRIAESCEKLESLPDHQQLRRTPARSAKK